MLVCARCGKENADEARSCLNCGARFGGQDESAPFLTVDERRAPPLVEVAGTKDELEIVATPRLFAGVGERRDPLLVLILGFVTCYIYLFYWWYATAADIKRATGRQDIYPQIEVLLNILTCGLYTIYLSYKYPKLILEMQEKAHVIRNDTSLMSVLLSLFSLGPIACYVIQKDLNRIWETIESRES
ncbi:MAG: DUF4234 domain-containing protein [Pyrinomonadaceae bacterium]|nr:DUF4234 domain-containing protein [Pyrinomonadaceae bacterium]